MKKYLTFLSFLFVILISIQSKAQSFFSKNNEGDTIFYKITSSIIPYTVEVTYDYLHLGNDYVGYISVPEKVTNNGITYSVTSIGMYAFSYCNRLKSVIIPNSVINIDTNSFTSCKRLKSIIIPESVTTIGKDAFSDCDSLESIIVKSLIPPIFSTYDIWYYNSAVPIFVNCTSKSLYNSAQCWSNYNIVGVNFDTIINHRMCKGDIYNQNGFYETEEGLYNKLTQDTGNCYKLKSLSIILGKEYNDTINATICSGNSYTQNGFNVDSAGFYSKIMQTISGCDSIINLNLTVEVTPSIPNGLLVEQISSFLEVTWQGYGKEFEIYRDDSLISKVNHHIFLDTNIVEGKEYCYSIIAINENCKSEPCVSVCKKIVGLNDLLNSEKTFKLYPNPTNGKSLLEIDGLKQDANIIVSDLFGRVFNTYYINAGQKQLEINCANLPSGIYYVNIRNKEYNLTRKLIIE